MAIDKNDAANNKKDPVKKKRATPAASARRLNGNKPKNDQVVPENKAPAKTTKKSARTGSRSVDNSRAPQKTVSGKFQKILDDISNHKITDKQNAYLATFPELNREPILELDKDGVICYLNPSGKSLFPDLPALGTGHPLLSDYAEVQKTIRRGRKAHPVTNERQIGSDYYERTFLPVGENHVRIYTRDITKRKIAEQNLQTAEQALHNEVENSPLGIAIVGINAEKIYANRALLNIFGFVDMQEFLDTPVRSFYSPESWKDSEVRRLRRQRGEQVQDGYEIMIIRKDGQKRHLQCFRSKILWEGILRDEALYQDITESKLAEDALKASEVKYSTLVEQSSDGILILDKRQILFANQRMSEISGYTIEQLIGKYFPELFTAESKNILDEGFIRRQASPMLLPADYKLHIQTIDGRKTPVETKAKRIFYKDSYNVMVIVRDISDRENAQQALQVSEQNFRNSIENSPLGIRIVNPQGETLYTNKALLDIYGYRDLEEFNSTPVKNRYTAESYVAFQIRMEKRRRHKPLPDNYEVSVIRKDGTERQLQVMRKEVLWGGKQEFLTLYVDITQRNQMLTILNELNSILQLITIINQLIVKTDNETELLQQACEQFVTNRRYELGWIGLIKEGSYDVVPSAMAGKDTDYLSTLHIRWDDSEYSRGPTGTAIKTRKTSSVKDIAQDPRFLPWRDAALKRGLKSAASLPLIIEDKVIGVMSLYSSAEDAFNEKELYLLGELASDLSLGIEKIRRRQQHLLLEETLRQERDRAQTYLDTAGVMMVVVNTDGKVALINRRGCEILGSGCAEIIGKNWFDNFVPERKREQSLNTLRMVLAGKIDPVAHYENQVVAKDGQEKTISWNSVELRDEKGQITGILSSGEDITERKKAEAALIASEQNFRNSIDRTFIGWYIVDKDWKALYVNQAFLQMFGYKDIAEVRTSPPHNYYTPESTALFRKRREQEMSGAKVSDTFEIDIVRKDGVKRHLQIFRRQVLWDGEQHDQISYNDITERVQAEEALKASEENFRNSIDSSPMGIRITDIHDSTLYLNQAFLNIFGYENIDDVRGDSPVKFYSKDSYADYLQRKAKRLRGEAVPQQVDINITRRDGSLRYIQIFPREVFWNGKQQFQTIYNDITERKQAEQALRASEQNFRNSMDSSPIGIRILDAEWHTLYANHVYLDIFGFNNIAEIDSVTPQELYTAKGYQLYLERQQKRARGEYVSEKLDLEILRKDGAVRYVQTSRSEVLWNGQKQYQMLINDVTELQLAEQALKVSEQNFHNSLDNSFEGINIADDQGRVYYVNKAFLDIFGYKNIEEVRASPPHEHYTPEERARYQRRLETLQRGERNPDEIEIDIIRLDGQTRHLQVFRREVLWDNKKQRMVLFNDITDRVQAEKALRESEEKYRLIVENSRDIIFTINADGILIYISPSINKLLGYGQNELIGKTFTSIVHPDDTTGVIDSIRLNIQQGLNMPNGVEFRVRHHSGEWRWQNGIGTAVRDDKGAFISFIGVIRDITEHRQIEKALQESEEKYRLIVENSQDIIFTLNSTGEFVYISPSVKNVLGYDQSRLIGRPFMSIVHDEDVHIIRTVSEFNDTVTGEYHSPDIQYRVRHASGESRWLSSKGTIIRDKDRNFINFIGIANDITARKQTEKALLESKEKYRLIVENSQDIIFTLNSTGEFVYVSPAVTGVLGYSQTELIGRPFLSIVIPEDMQLLQDTIQHTHNLLGDYQYPDLEYRVRHRSDGFRWLFTRSTVMRDKNHNFLNFLGIANDITERKKTEEALKASEQNFRNSMDTSSTGIRISDMENHTMYANKALLGIFGYADIHEVETKPPHEFYAPESYAAFLERNRHLHRGDPMPNEIELDILRKDGSLRHLLVAMKEIMWDRNQRYQTIYRDITEDKKAEEEKHRIEEKAQVASRLAAMGEMAAGIAHEINNPLTGVLGFSQIMIAKENVPEEIKDDLRMIAESSQRVADIVKRLLTFARQAKPVKSYVNLNELIDNTLKLRDYVLKTANIDVVTHLDPALPWSYVDPGQLQQVFLNLIVNAEQAMKETQNNGTLTITTGRKGNIIRIVFKDNGPGITKENMVHLFEPFFTTKAPGEGTGLGLSLSRSIILEHDGKMNVESESGHGAAFIIELPVIEIPPQLSSDVGAVKIQKPTVIRKGKILVVDDEPVVRSTLARVLTKMGHTVDAIADAGKAIEKLDSGIVYDLILSDVMMPGMNGIELYSRILEKAPAMKNKIIFITGDVMGLDIKTFLTTNNLSYLAKPFDIELLKEKTNLMMAEQSADKPQESAG